VGKRQVGDNAAAHAKHTCAAVAGMRTSRHVAMSRSPWTTRKLGPLPPVNKDPQRAHRRICAPVGSRPLRELEDLVDNVEPGR
jgi:hypothetical protein